MQHGLSSAHAIVQPSVTVVSASAGSGKTHELTMRYVQLLLTPGVRQQALRNILAMTFTRNAAAEMRNRILALLKRAHLGDPDILPLLKERIPLAEGRIREDAGLLVGRILQEYENYQIRTIDSFLARVFKASALELGYSPDMEIALDPGPLLDEAFDRCARDLREGTSLGKRFLAIAEDLALASPAYIWNPFARLQEKLTRLLTMMSKSPLPVAEPPDPRAVEPYVDRLATLAQQILDVCTADAAGELPAMNKHFAQDLQDAVKKEWRRLLSRTAKDDVLTKPRTARQKEAVGRARERLDVLVGEYRATLQSIAEIDAKAHVRAEFLAARELMTYLDATKRSQGQLTLDDVNHLLAQYLTEGGVPDVYLALGESIYHYCLDEFQDTSPLQWAALRPLLEESLAKEGTLFVVGDTKQSIYGFRDADWRIMRGLEEGRERFPSAGDVVTRRLETNRRSDEAVVRACEELFRRLEGDPALTTAVRASGLHDVHQEVLRTCRGRGHVEVRLLSKDPSYPEKEEILERIRSAHARGYAWRDIAVLAAENDDIIHVSGWLNQARIPFLSHSSLDIRRRTIVGEVRAMLRFLDSPIDDLAFATVVLGRAFASRAATLGAAIRRDALTDLLDRHGRSGTGPLYTTFRSEYRDLWDTLFAALLSTVGHLPLYDLLCDICKTFDLLRSFPDEEAALIRLLEAATEYEAEGETGLAQFLLALSESDPNDPRWSLYPPAGSDFVSLMTVHKAKGMEFPVVILYNREKNLRRPTMVRSDLGGELALLHVTDDHARHAPVLQTLREEEYQGLLTDSLNRLYVALTRAQHELHVVNVSDTPPGIPGAYLEERTPPGVVRPAAEPSGRSMAERSHSPQHHTLPRAAEPMNPEGIGFEQTRRGEEIHEVLSRIEYLDADADPEPCVEALQLPGRRQTETNNAVTAFLRPPEIRELFLRRPGRVVLAECDIVRRDGCLFRADRIVVDAGLVRVVDFKTGGDVAESHYREQVRNYVEILEELYPGYRVEGYLGYVDLRQLRRVA